ncbi:hypothetical protein GJAV_G00072330 [Gymnothorax javanicus]|nr:hypothetical protein GJAV_G00072330 [Gymnothorax javanicus]
MLCRLYLAAMHYNENRERPQKRTEDGQLIFKLHYAKIKPCTVQPLKEEATFNYVDDLMDLLFREVFELPHGFRAELQEINVPPPLASKEDRPAKEDIVAKYASCFNRGAT